MAQYKRTKKPMVAIALRLPCSLRELWHNAALREEISQSDFLRRSIEERAARILMGKRPRSSAYRSESVIKLRSPEKNREPQALRCPNCDEIAEAIPTPTRTLAIIRCAICDYSELDLDG
jgi:hypothetical protein